MEGKIPKKIDLKRLAEVLKKVHSIKRKGRSWREFLLRKFEKGIEALKGINKNLYKIFRKIFEDIVKEYGDLEDYGLVHGDICKYNIIEREGKYYLIDWEHSMFGDPIIT